jgi:hypothetical protein
MFTSTRMTSGDPSPPSLDERLFELLDCQAGASLPEQKALRPSLPVRDPELSARIERALSMANTPLGEQLNINEINAGMVNAMGEKVKKMRPSFAVKIKKGICHYLAEGLYFCANKLAKFA